jgi:uncharacterized protein (DUF2141 family)
MKAFTLFGLFLNMSILCPGQDVEVIVKNVKNEKGVLMVGLFNSEKTFTMQPLKGEMPAAKVGTITVVFKKIPAGKYAIAVFHDANQNGKLDTNFMGVPKEGFGFSNDVMGNFGPPSFEKAKFSCPISKPVSVTMKYF